MDDCGALVCAFTVRSPPPDLLYNQLTWSIYQVQRGFSNRRKQDLTLSPSLPFLILSGLQNLLGSSLSFLHSTRHQHDEHCNAPPQRSVLAPAARHQLLPRLSQGLWYEGSCLLHCTRQVRALASSSELTKLHYHRKSRSSHVNDDPPHPQGRHAAEASHLHALRRTLKSFESKFCCGGTIALGPEALRLFYLDAGGKAR